MASKKDSTHAQYDAMSATWKKCRDATKGQRAVHAGRTAYLPKLSGQTDDEYKAYLQRALYFNATGRTVEAMRGLAFRKKGVLEVPEAMKAWLSDITMTGRSLDGLSRDILNDAIVVGRYGLLVDYPEAPAVPAGAKVTVAQAQAIDMRPYFCPFVAEDILNWNRSRVGSATKLSQVMLRESYSENDTDKVQILELTIESGYYEQVIWRKVEDKQDEWVEFDRHTPKKNGAPLKEIPFWFIGPSEKSGDVCDPPIEDLVYINLSHYMNSADLENGAHVSGLPTPYITGVTKDDTGNNVLQLGTGAAWLIPDANAKVGFAQVGQEGFASLEKLMDRKEQQMAAVGARMIAPEKKAAEAAETASIRRGGENSVLADVVGTVDKPIEQALIFARDWQGLTGDVRYELNKDFLPLPMGAAELTAWVGAYQAGAISEETFYEGLQSGELVSETLTFADEQERKQASGPAPGLMGGNGNDQ